jgi:hypothetical protein
MSNIRVFLPGFQFTDFTKFWLLKSSFSFLNDVCSVELSMLLIMLLSFSNLRRHYTDNDVVGIDSIGGVRVPGGYCGVLAFRPSHAVISNSGVIPVAPSLDTIGTTENIILIITRNIDLDL